MEGGGDGDGWNLEDSWAYMVMVSCWTWISGGFCALYECETVRV